jgi:chromosome segregation ATPase
MPSKPIIILEQASRDIKALVSKLSEHKLETYNAAIPPGELQVLTRKLARVARTLDRVSSSQREEPGLQAAIDEYVDNLKELKRALGSVQDSLSKRRDQLKKDLRHLSSTRAWVETFRATNSI